MGKPDMPAHIDPGDSPRLSETACLALLTLVGALTRLVNLGGRSLWLDEFSTWHVSRMPFWRSVTWEAELTPPLYQACVRGVAALAGHADLHPTSEWILRLPAALAGALLAPAAWWLARITLARAFPAAALVALSAAAVVAVHPLLVEYSREARPYSLLALLCVIATACWWQLHHVLVRPDRPRAELWWAAAYVATAALALYAHTLAALTLAAHAVWIWVQPSTRRNRRGRLLAWAAFAAVAALAAPLALRASVQRDALHAGLEWIEPATAARALDVFATLSPGLGLPWAMLLLAGVVLIARHNATRGERGRAIPGSEARRPSPALLFLTWFATVLGGLVALSYAYRPLLVPRFAIAAAVPAVLFPLAVAARAGRWWVLLMTALSLLVDVRELPRLLEPRAGLRELVNYIDDNAAPADLVVLCVWAQRPSGVEYERLGLRYYAPRVPWVEWPLRSGPPAILGDPRGLWLIVFQGDPEPQVRAAGRRTTPFALSGGNVRLLYFEPYRLMRVAPAAEAGPDAP